MASAARPSRARGDNSSMKRDSTHRVANPARNQAMIELRGSGAAGPHKDRRTLRARTRNSAQAKAIAFAS